MTNTEKFRNQAKQVMEKGTMKDNTYGYEEPERFVPTGSTLLNLALSNKAHGGWSAGHPVHVIGDSNTGKSVLALSAHAEAAHNPAFDNYGLWDLDAESSRDFDIPDMFGTKTADRLESVDDVDTIEDWHSHMINSLEGENKPPFIEVVDSLNGLPSKSDVEAARQRAKGKDKETMGAGQASTLSECFPQIVGELENSNSLVLLVSQTREPINAGGFKTKDFSGGKALWFYCHQRVWLAVLQKIKKTYKGKDWPVGNWIRVFVQRTRVTGRSMTIDFPIQTGYGIDDVWSVVSFLKSCGWWSKTSSQKINAHDLGIEGTEAKLIEEIEQNEWEDQLKEIAENCWSDVLENITPNRKKKYK